MRRAPVSLPRRCYGRSILGAAIAIATLAPSGVAADPARFRIETTGDGVVAVTYQDLLAAGLAAELPSDQLSLSNRGTAVPLWVADGGDGRFGPGDRLEFVAERLPGASATYHEFSRLNVYWLAVDGAAGARMQTSYDAPSAGVLPALPPRRLERRVHLEEDRLMIRLRGSEVDPERPPELWHWAKLTHLDREPWRLALDLPDLARGAGDPVELTVAFQGLSEGAAPAAPGPPDHRVEIVLAGAAVAAAEWSGRARQAVSATLPAAALTGSDLLEFRVPRRRGSDGEPIVDVVMLDWVAVSYPAGGRAEGPQSRLHLAAASAPGRVDLILPEDRAVVVYSDRGRRLVPAASGPVASFLPAAGERSYWVVPAGSELAPERVELDRPSDLAGVDQQADYLMIAHRRLLDAVAPLAEHHRARGLAVAVVDVQDVYDAFNHGILDPRALRDFIAHAYHRWRRPAPRFVLLVGDASWDTKNETVDGARYANWPDRQLLARGGFPPKEGAVYGGDPRANDRNLIPTWNYPSLEGHAASDNWFVAVDGEDFLPDLAIGRLPLTRPEEVEAVVAKTLRYAAAPPGPWRSRILWVTDAYYASRVRTDFLADSLAPRGFAATKVYPLPTTDLEVQRAALRQAFADGHLLVHFVGHGGRYIWRTGPPDLEHQRDLFGLEDVVALPASERLPVVLSVACHSAPFDHPNADSIGETFLRVADRGAVAVVAASWRHAPGPEVSQALVEELLAGGTVGEALQRAKRRLLEPTFAATYNLLGDPAIALALPPLAAAATPR